MMQQHQNSSLRVNGGSSSSSPQLKELFEDHSPELTLFVENYMCEVFFPETQIGYDSFPYLHSLDSYEKDGATQFCSMSDIHINDTTDLQSNPVFYQEHHDFYPLPKTESKQKPSFDLTRTKKTRRLVWTQELHRLFLEVVKELGEDGSF